MIIFSKNSVPVSQKIDIKKSFDPAVWVDEHGNYLYMFAFSRVQDELIAEDLVRETLLAALASFDSFPSHKTARMCLTGILKNRIVDYFRSSTPQGDLTEEEADFSSYQYLFDDKFWNDHWTPELIPGEWPFTPEQVLEKGEFCRVLTHCLAELPKRIAGAFTLHEMDGLEGREICDILHVSKDNYRVMLHRARTHLRRCLEMDWLRKIEAEGELAQ